LVKNPRRKSARELFLEGLGTGTGKNKQLNTLDETSGIISHHQNILGTDK